MSAVYSVSSTCMSSLLLSLFFVQAMSPHLMLKPHGLSLTLKHRILSLAGKCRVLSLTLKRRFLLLTLKCRTK